MTTPARPFVALAAIAALEGIGLLVYGLFDLIQGLRVGATGPADVSNVPAIALQIVLFAAFGLGLLWVATGWWKERRWARAPFLVAQLMALVIGVPLAQAVGSERLIGIVLALLALVGIVLVFTPAVMREFEAQ